MCGIFGALKTDPTQIDLDSVFDSLRLRGPNDRGSSYNEKFGILQGHTRLSIHDLSPLGHQPMASSSGRYEIAFNGEVYNYIELRETLEASGVSFRGDSDTEVMLACFEYYGVRSSLERFKGMFAFSLLDLVDGQLYMARDRMGEKPLFYYEKNGQLAWASSLHALRGFGLDLNVSRPSLSKLLRYNYIPAPYSIYENVFKLEPGCLLTMDLTGDRLATRIDKYWALDSFVKKPPLTFDSDEEALLQLEGLLKSSISEQMHADVPLGAFLSGGVDSSLIVALMQNLDNRRVKTFSMGFEDPRYNEAPFAREVATHLNTDHTEYIVTAKDALEVIPKLASIYDEPFADSSQIPTYLVSALAKRQVTVALSGDGGDELFHGYTRYQQTEGRFERFSQLGCGLLGNGLSRMSRAFRQMLSSCSGGRVTSRQILAVSDFLRESNRERFYHSSISCNLEPEAFVLGADLSDSMSSKFEHFVDDFPRDYAFNDIITYLPDDILAKVDRAAMAVSLETRVPFLDRDLVEFALRLPLSYKLRNGEGKWLLRQLLYRYVPQQLIDRPKRGFAVPLGDWLRSELKEWASELLAPTLLIEQGYFNEKSVSFLWNEHQRGNDVSRQLWPILMFQEWLVTNG